MNIEDLVLIKVEAEGYWSGAKRLDTAVVEKSFVEEWEDSFHTVYYTDLDGKHSEMKGDVSFVDITKDNLKEVIDLYLDGGCDAIWEQMFYSVIEGELDYQWEIDEKFGQSIHRKVETVYFFKGEFLGVNVDGHL